MADLDDLNYLNLQEIRSVCDRLGIPYRIVIELPGGGSKVTSDTDRKPVILERLRRYLTTGKVPEATRLPASIVRLDGPPPVMGPDDRLYYRWYNKTYAPVMDGLRELTGGRFRNGALARVLVMEFWTRGTAPTLREFAEAWTAAGSRDLVRPEYAFLTDLRDGDAGADWKRKRQEKAKQALSLIDERRNIAE